MHPAPFTRIADRVSIVGFCQPDRDWAPYYEPDMEIWGLNRGMIFMPRADRWFELHSPSIHEWQQRRPGRHLEFLRRFPGPVYMHQARPDLIPGSVDYPLREVAEALFPLLGRFGAEGQTGERGSDAPYLTSTVALEIALAIHMGYQEISLYGIDLNTASEYAWQKPGVECMLGLAMGRGIRVRLPGRCPLLQGTIYGRGYLSPKGEIVSPQQWMERINTLIAQKAQIERQINETQGAKGALEWVIAQMVPNIDQEALDQRRQAMEKTIAKLQMQGYQCVGALQESLHWAHQTPDGQDPREALGQLIAATGDPEGHPEAVIAQLAAAELPRNGYRAAEGPEEGSVAAALLDAATGDPGRWVTLLAGENGALTDAEPAGKVPSAVEG